MVRERDIEKWLVSLVKRMGGEAFKFVSPGNDGVPDRLVCMPGGRVYFVELKTDGGRPSGLQQWQMDRLRRLGLNVHLITGMEEAARFIETLRKEVMPDEVHAS